MLKNNHPLTTLATLVEAKDSFAVIIIGEGGQTAFKTFDAAEKFIQAGLADGTIGRYGAYLDTYTPKYSRRLYTKKRPQGADFDMPRND